MTDNELSQPPTLIEPDSDDEGPRKRQRIDEGSTTDQRLAVLQAALMLVVAAELHTDENLNLYEVLSHRISNFRDVPTVHHITPSISNVATPRIEPDSMRTTESVSSKIPRRHQAELSHMCTNSQVQNPMATSATTNRVTRKVSTLPSGRPLLAPPRLPHVKCGERLTRPSSRQTPLQK